MVNAIIQNNEIWHITMDNLENCLHLGGEFKTLLPKLRQGVDAFTNWKCFLLKSSKHTSTQEHLHQHIA
jgi:hypothetical protein